MLVRGKHIEVETYHYQPQKTADGNFKKVQRVAAYTRVSTLLENQEDSFETQCAYYESLISSNPKMILVGVYGDQGVSGLSTKGRTEFARMMKDCKAGKIDLVITRSVSRLSRNMAECLETVNTLKELGIPVRFEKEGLTSTDPGCEMFFHVMATLAQEESGSLSRRLIWAVEHRAEIGDPIRACAYGYRKGPKENGQKNDSGREWLIYEPEARRVRRAFEMASDLYPYQAILQQLNLMEEAEGTGVTWKQGRLYKLLRSEMYRGDVLTHKTYTVDYVTKTRAVNRGEHPQYYIQGHHEPMVPIEMFERVQSLMDAGLLNSLLTVKLRRHEKDAERWRFERAEKIAIENARKRALEKKEKQELVKVIDKNGEEIVECGGTV